MIIDILIAVAEKGGVENIINMVVPYFRNQRKWDVRVVQLVWEGYTWTDKDTPFYPLLRGREGHTLEEFVKVYAEFLKDNGVPDVVLATAWPYTCYIGKKALVMQDGSDTKVISWLHAPVEQYEKAGYGGYSYLALADMHLTISQLLYEGLKEKFSDKLMVRVNNPVDFSKSVVQNGKTVSREAKCKKLYYVGRIAVEKRLDVIIRALGAASSAWELWIIGDGDANLRSSLKGLADECHVSKRIHWMGWKKNPWEYAASADALVLASEFEGFPLVAIEALANGVPVISTPVSGITELISPGVNGYIFPKEDWKFLANILNMMAEGKLPAIQPEECKKSAASYDKKQAIPDFACKIAEMAVHQNELILAEAGQNFTYCGDRISVIIPCYNVSPYIKECIDSLLASTLPLCMLEFIFVDDASVDDTCEIIEQYEALYPENILLVRCEENRRQGAARNLGMSYATGNYIAFVDSDDKIHPEMLQRLYEKIALYSCDMAGCGYTIFDEDGIKGSIVSDKRLYFLTDQKERKEYILNHGCKNAVWSHLYCRQFLEENGISFPEDAVMEDLFFYQLCMMTAKSCFEVSDALYYYRNNPAGTMNTINEHNFMDTYIMQDRVYESIDKRNLVRGFEQELAVVYYVKAFVEPTYHMQEGTNGIIWDEEKFQMLKGAILSRFPDILTNPYILSDKSEYNSKYIALLEGELEQ